MMEALNVLSVFLGFVRQLNPLSFSSCSGRLTLFASSLFACFSVLFCNIYVNLYFSSLSLGPARVEDLLTCFSLAFIHFSTLITCLLIYEFLLQIDPYHL